MEEIFPVLILLILVIRVQINKPILQPNKHVREDSRAHDDSVRKYFIGATCIVRGPPRRRG
jgi:hypothetical protein